jgi:hypothetical protein
MSQKTTWLIQRRNGDEYLTIDRGHFEWTPSREKALHFLRECDATAVIVLTARLSAHLYVGLPFTLNADDFPPIVYEHTWLDDDDQLP